MRLLLIEDDATLGDGLRDYLRAEGHQVDWAESLSQADAYRGEAFDAVLVDWQLPDGSGRDWIQARRTRGDTTPMLMITARDRLDDRVLGLDSGADDYLVKPFERTELLARIRALLRRRPPRGAASLEVGDLTLNPDTREVRRGKRELELTNREFELLEFLMRNERLVVSRERLLDDVWGYDPTAATNTIDVFISNLRRKLEADGEPRLLHTKRGAGYVVKAPRPDDEPA
jgi:DNA-binding response OmpR family regulator